MGEKLVKFRKEIPFSALWQNQGKNGISAKTEKPKTNRGLLKSKKILILSPVIHQSVTSAVQVHPGDFGINAG